MRNAWLCLLLLSASIGSSSLARAQAGAAVPPEAAAAPTPPPAFPVTSAPVTAEPATAAVEPARAPLPPLPPKNRLVLNNLLVIRFNPVGLEDQMRFGFQRRLWERTSPYGRDNFVFLGIAPRLNPAFIKIGPSFEFQPYSFFNLRVGVEYLRFFSTFGFLQSFPSPLDEYDDRRIAICSSQDPAVLAKCGYKDAQGTQLTGADQPRNFPASGVHLMIEPTLQGRFGPLTLRNKLAIEYWYMQTRPGDTVFYDVTLDTLVPQNGWVLTNDLDMLYVTSFRLSVGLRYTVVKALYRDSDFRAGEERSSEDNMLQRLGPMLSYTFFDRGFTRFNKPTILLITSFYLDHRYRKGQAASQVVPAVFANNSAIPYVIIGFSFQSDFINTYRVPPKAR
jgi:hypothetical protein